jgi:hypothetical protein
VAAFVWVEEDLGCFETLLAESYGGAVWEFVVFFEADCFFGELSVLFQVFAGRICKGFFLLMDCVNG